LINVANGHIDESPVKTAFPIHIVVCGT